MEQSVPEKIIVNEDIFLSPPERTDIRALVTHLAEKEIYDRTLMIPFPYTDHDSEAFVRLTQLRHKAYGNPLDWAIRSQDGKLMGMISFHGASQYDKSREELGYWLGKSFWNRGIMTEVLKRFVLLGFENYGFEHLELPIFVSNEASKKVALKCGFHFKEQKPKAHIKDGQPIDVDVFLRLKSEIKN